MIYFVNLRSSPNTANGKIIKQISVHIIVPPYLVPSVRSEQFEKFIQRKYNKNCHIKPCATFAASTGGTIVMGSPTGTFECMEIIKATSVVHFNSSFFVL